MKNSAAFLFIVLLTGGGVGARADMTPAQASANKLWKSFLSCAKLKTEAAPLDACLDKTLYAKLNTYEKNKHFEFLTMDFDPTELFPCSAEILEEIKIPGQKENAMCFKMRGQRYARVGVVYFKLGPGEKL